MNATTVSLVFGIVFLAIGILGFFPGLLQAPPVDAPDLAVDSFYGYLFGLFSVNVVHNLVHVLFGIWGLVGSRTWSASRAYLKSVAVIYAVLAVFGLVPVLWTTFGLVPIFGHDVWLHVALAVVAGYFGFRRETAPAPTMARTA